MQVTAGYDYDTRASSYDYSHYRLTITELQAKLGTRLDEKRIQGFNERIPSSPINGTFAANDDGTVLYLLLDSANDYPNCIGALQEFLAYSFGFQPIQYDTLDGHASYVREVDGNEWCCRSGNTIYEDARDLIGMEIY